MTGRTVRAWVREFVKDRNFKLHVREYNKHGLHSFIAHKDLRESMREWLDDKIYRRKKGEPQRRVRDFQT